MSGRDFAERLDDEYAGIHYRDAPAAGALLCRRCGEGELHAPQGLCPLCGRFQPADPNGPVAETQTPIRRCASTIRIIAQYEGEVTVTTQCVKDETHIDARGHEEVHSDGNNRWYHERSSNIEEIAPALTKAQRQARDDPGARAHAEATP